MKKRSKSTLLIAVILMVVAGMLIFSSTKSTLKSESKNFAVDDTANVTKIFLSDKQNRSVKLEKDSSGGWIVNGQFQAKSEAMVTLLKTMMNIEVREPVSKAAHNNVVKRLAAIGIKVEIYEKKYWIDLFGLQLFPHEKLTKTYYVGDATKDNMGTYMLIENSEKPYVVFIPGFNGFLFTRYSTNVDDWLDHSVFSLRLSHIKTVTLQFPENPELSYTITNFDNRKFGLRSLKDNKEISDYDTVRLLEVLSSFENIKYESLINDLEKTKKDSVLASIPFHILTVTDKNGKSTSIKTYHIKANEGEEDIATGEPIFFNRDRMYALINDGKDFALIQFYVFGKITRPLTYFKRGKDLSAQTLK